MKDILLIMGAGSSKNIEDSFPTGVELAERINSYLSTIKKEKNPANIDYVVDNPPFHPKCPYISDMVNKFMLISSLDSESIDSLLTKLKRRLYLYSKHYEHYAFRHDYVDFSIDRLIDSEFDEELEIQRLARFCISYLLKGQECAYHKYLNSNQQRKIIGDTWIYGFYRELKNKYNSYDQVLNQIDIMTFNYERLFEYLTCEVIKDLFKVNVSSIENLHYVYGNIGNLDEIKFKWNNDNQRYVDSNSYEAIRLINDERNRRIILNLNGYKKVLFVGFGFDRDNLNLLSEKEKITTQAFGMTSCKTDVHFEIEREYNIQIEVIQNKDISQFISSHIN